MEVFQVLMGFRLGCRAVGEPGTARRWARSTNVCSAEARIEIQVGRAMVRNRDLLRNRTCKMIVEGISKIFIVRSDRECATR
jgi:hypothetical protein